MKEAYVLQFGNYCDNLEALEVARRARKEGNWEYAHFILAGLQEHIRKTGEMKSFYWLSPVIEIEIYSLENEIR